MSTFTCANIYIYGVFSTHHLPVCHFERTHISHTKCRVHWGGLLMEIHFSYCHVSSFVLRSSLKCDISDKRNTDFISFCSKAHVLEGYIRLLLLCFWDMLGHYFSFIPFYTGLPHPRTRYEQNFVYFFLPVRKRAVLVILHTLDFSYFSYEVSIHFRTTALENIYCPEMVCRQHGGCFGVDGLWQNL